MKKKIRLEELNQKSFTRSGVDKAILAFGSCESHGAHLPFGIDTFVSYCIASEVAERVGNTVVVPPLWYGMSLHYRHKPMCISLSNETLTRVVREVLLSLIYWGIKKIIIINGHDGNIPCIEVAARDVKQDYPEAHIIVLDAWWYTAGNLLPQDTFDVWNGLGHGGEGETSIALAMVPELVDMSEAKGMLPELDSNIKLIWNFNELTDYGATGAPEKASREKGRQMKEVLVDYLVKYIEDLESRGWKVVKK